MPPDPPSKYMLRTHIICLLWACMCLYFYVFSLFIYSYYYRCCTVCIYFRRTLGLDMSLPSTFAPEVSAPVAVIIDCASIQ